MMRLTRLDFVPGPPPVRGWRLALLVFGLLVSIGTGVRWWLQADATAALEGQLSRAQPRAVAIPVRSAARQRKLEMQAKAIGEAVRQLNLPITDLIKTLQPPKDIRVALLGLDVGGKGVGSESDGVNAAGVLKIAAEARTPQEMTTYVAFLGDQPLFRSVYLVKHEIHAASPERPYRFLLEAQWRE